MLSVFFVFGYQSREASPIPDASTVLSAVGKGATSSERRRRHITLYFIPALPLGEGSCDMDTSFFFRDRRSAATQSAR